MRYARLCLVVAAVVVPVCAQAGEGDEPDLIHQVLQGEDLLHIWTSDEHNDGELVVVVAGGPGLSHEYTEPLAAPIVDAGHRVVFYDPPGTGPDGVEATTHETNRLARDIERIRLWAGREQVHLVAHSWGGFVVGAYLDAHPQRAASIALIDAVPPSDDGLVRTSRGIDARAEELGLQQRPGAPCAEALIALLPAYFHDPDHAATSHLSGSRCSDTVFSAALWEATGNDFSEAARRFAGPVLVVQGASDPFGQAVFDELVELYGADSSALLAECGHIPWEECPAALDAPLSQFLAALPDTGHVVVTAPEMSCACPEGSECSCDGSGRVTESRRDIDTDRDGVVDAARIVTWEDGVPFRAEDTEPGAGSPFRREHCMRSGATVTCREYDVDGDETSLRATRMYRVDAAGAVLEAALIADGARIECEVPETSCLPLFCSLSCDPPSSE